MATAKAIVIPQAHTLTPGQAADLFNMLCGERVGTGVYRTVYKCRIAYDNNTTDTVIKLDNCDNWSNIMEWRIWKNYEGTPLEKWLAPIFSISENGMWLIQAETTPFENAKQMPKRIPALFADVKLANWGMYKGRPVCHDYAAHNVFELAQSPATQLVATKNVLRDN